MSARSLPTALLIALLLAPVLTAAYAQPLPDPLRSEQYGLDLIHAPVAWQTATGQGVRVAIIDSGVDHTHLDLVHQIAHTEGQSVAEPFGVLTNLPVGPWDTTQDTDGHGTLVAGVLAAERGNGIGIAGTSEATVIAIKVNDLGVLPVVQFLADGIQAAIEADVDIVQVSLSVSTSSPELDAALAQAEREGIVVVAASGNQGQSSPRWPAAAGTVLAVGAIDEQGQHWAQANQGVAVVAPGVEVLSTGLANTYQAATGTSLAAPFVSGTIALMLEACPTMSPADVRDRVNGTAEDLAQPGYDAATGWGMVRADRAVQQAQIGCATPMLEN